MEVCLPQESVNAWKCRIICSTGHSCVNKVCMMSHDRQESVLHSNKERSSIRAIGAGQVTLELGLQGE